MIENKKKKRKMAKNLSLGTILGIVIVTTLIVSIATVSITGNVIKVRINLVGKEIYKRAEIDKKLNNFHVVVVSVLHKLNAVEINLNNNSSIKTVLIGKIHIFLD